MRRDLDRLMADLRRSAEAFGHPAVSRDARSRTPFEILVSCMISLRTKDAVTDAASRRLFRLARMPDRMSRLSEKRISAAIYPAGFYRQKAGSIAELSRRLAGEYGGKVPASVDELLKFRGVGRKTANLVAGLGFGVPAICVDTHVHRISNRLGLVRTRTPEETEASLRKVLPRKYWIEINGLLVAYGQNVCKPLSPACSRCAITWACRRVGVRRSR